MRSYSRKRRNNIIIGTLCGVMLLMVVGYAAFASQLNIKGTSGISSNWDIEITNIRAGNPAGGDAYDINEPTYTPSTATFNTGLKTPGTSRVYEVEVTNKGTLTGLVTIANLSCGDNDAIGCNALEYDKKIADDNWNEVELTEQPNGIDYFEQGQQDYSDIEFTLAPGEKHYLYVTVMYNDVTSQPENLSANINLELTYEQAVDDGAGSFIPNRPKEVIYSWTTNKLNIGDSVESIETTNNYATLGKEFFLKHNTTSGKVESNELCFLKDNQMHCLKPNEYETSKAALLNIFGEDSCTGDSDRFSCNNRWDVRIYPEGDIKISTEPDIDDTCPSCNIYTDGSAQCTAMCR